MNKFAFPLGLLALAVAQGLSAEEIQLEAFTIEGDVLGSASEQEVRSYAGSRSLVEEKDLQKASVRGLDDALQRVPGVKIFDETGTGVLPQLSVRGLYESRSGRVQALADGIPLALGPYGQTSLSLFPQTLATVERIDVVRGGAAVQYGPNNVGGVINFISKPIPREWETTLQERLTFAAGGHRLWDTYIGTGGELTGNFALQLDLNTIAGEYGRDHSDTEVQNYRLRGQWDVTDDSSLSFGVQRYIADMDLAGALSVEDYRHDPRASTRPLDRFEGDTDRVWFTWDQYLGSFGPFDSAEFSWTNFAHNSYRNFIIGLPFDPGSTPTTLQDAPRDFRVWGSEPRLSLSIDGDRVSQTWLLGARLVREDVEFDVNRTDRASGAFSVIRDWSFDDEAEAAYLSNRIALLDERLTITPGVRYEHASMEYADGVSGSQVKTTAEEWLPGLSVGFQLDEQWFLYGDAQRSLRLPQITSIVRDGDVAAELAWNYEAGVRFTPQDNLRLDFGLYRIEFKDQIEYDRSIAQFRNLGSTRHQGVELQAFWTPAALPDLDLHLSYAFLDAELRAGANKGNEAPFASRHQLSADARYQFANGLEWTVDGLYVSSAFSDAANSEDEDANAAVGRIPSYWLLNTAVQREFKMADDSVLTASAGISNLLDRQYWFRGIDTSPWGRQTAPGRTLTLGVNYRF